MFFVARHRQSAGQRLFALSLIGLLLSIAVPASSATAAVNTFTGNYTYAHTDIRLPDDPLFKFERAYNSLDERMGPLGPGWTHNFNVRLAPDTSNGPDGRAFIGPDGRTDRYERRPDGTYRLAAIQGGTLVQQQEGPFTGSWELAMPNGTTYEFDADARPTRITFTGGFTTLLAYDEHSRLQTATTPGGDRRLTFGYDDADHLTSVSDWLDPPRQVTFGYDDLGRLATATDRLGHVTRYTYDGASQRIHELIDARDHVALRLEYDEGKRVARQWSARGVASGSLTTFAYERDPNARFLPSGGFSTTMSYPSAGYAPGEPIVVIHTFDGQARLVRIESRPSPDDEPLIEEYRWDPNWSRTVQPIVGGRTQSEIGPESGGSCVQEMTIPGLERSVQVGRQIKSSPASPSVPHAAAIDLQRVNDQSLHDPKYDAAGRLTEVTLEANRRAPATWSYSMDDEDRIVKISTRASDDGSLRTWAFRYDEVGNLVERQTQDGATTRYAYDERDSLVDVQRPGGESVHYEYDERGYLSKMTTTTADDADAEVVEYQHDGLGRLRRIIDHGTAPDGAPGHTTELSYQQFALTAICQR